MLKRKIFNKISSYLKSDSDKLLIIDGARQTGKTYSIRELGSKLYSSYIEIDMKNDKINDKLFAKADTIEKFYRALEIYTNNKIHDYDDTLIFLDEIQIYPHILHLMKSLLHNAKYKYIASSFNLKSIIDKNIILRESIDVISIYPLDFEEFLWANNYSISFVNDLRYHYDRQEKLSLFQHKNMMKLFYDYLRVGGMPKVVDSYVKFKNFDEVVKIQNEIVDLYYELIQEYENDFEKKMFVGRIYEMIPYFLNSPRKRMVIRDIENKGPKRITDYKREIEFFISSKIAICSFAVAEPMLPLEKRTGKQLLKLYLNDVGLYYSVICNIDNNAYYDNLSSLYIRNLYETVVAQELNAHGRDLFYFNRIDGEIQFLLDDGNGLMKPIVISYGEQNNYHRFLKNFMLLNEGKIGTSILLSDDAEFYTIHGIQYVPIYFIMFI